MQKNILKIVWFIEMIFLVVFHISLHANTIEPQMEVNQLNAQIFKTDRRDLWLIVHVASQIHVFLENINVALIL